MSVMDIFMKWMEWMSDSKRKGKAIVIARQILNNEMIVEDPYSKTLTEIKYSLYRYSYLDNSIRSNSHIRPSINLVIITAVKPRSSQNSSFLPLA